MSKTTELPSQEEAWVIRKEERRRKKETKDKTTSRSRQDEQNATTDSDPPKKKRKREALPDELEVDVSLPEPLSKKEARRAKKGKTNPAPTDTANAGSSDTKPKTGQTDEEKKAEKRSEYGVWIGNLPWSATKDSLRTFLTENSDITAEQITRVHLPPPTKPVNPSWTTKPLNKGFAYVDFSEQLPMYAAIALTETKMDGRALLIKNAKSFEGRPDKPKAEEAATDGKKGKEGHPPNKRVFVGNLAFDVSKEDLQEHYGQCGEIADVHMATFEDSGKCKGYAWVTFETVEAATSAVKGYIFKDMSKKEAKDADESDSDTAKKSKKRKWLINKLMGRDLRCEFAEDSTTRYNKRYGKEKEKEKPADIEGVHPDRMKQFGTEDKSERPRKPFREKRKVDPRTIKSGAAHTNAPRAPQGIVKSEGKKITFD